MPIPSALIRKKIVEFALRKYSAEMVQYLKKELQSGNTTAEEVREYATGYKFTKKSRNP